MASFDSEQVSPAASLERKLSAARARRQRILNPETSDPTQKPTAAAESETPVTRAGAAPARPAPFSSAPTETLEPMTQIMRRRRRGRSKRALPAFILGAAGAMIIGTSLAAFHASNRANPSAPWQAGAPGPQPLRPPALPSDLPSTYIRYDSQPEVNLRIELPVSGETESEIGQVP